MISVVLPVYNEEKNLEPLHGEITEVMADIGEDYEIVFVDDGSSDGSGAILERLAEEDDAVRVVTFRKNFGQSAALQAGFDHSEGDVVVAMDADMQNDPADIPKLLETLEEGYDCVSGWRHDRDDPLGKRIASRFAAFLQKPFLGKTVHDYGCTLKAYRREAVEDLNLYGEMHRYIPPLLRWRGYTVTEVKVNHREREHGRTKYGTGRLIRGFLDMLNVWFWQKFSQRPLHIFGTLGIFFGGIGGLTGVYMLYLKLFQGVNLSSHFLASISFFAVLMGIQFFTFGLLADIMLKDYHLSREENIYNVKTVLG